MAKVYEFLATGFEEVEALAPVDILRRGGLEVVTVSVTGHKMVESAHGVGIAADVLFEEVDSFDDADLLLLPGGMPGATNLQAHKALGELLKRHAAAGKRLGAICAAPMVLGSLQLLQGRKATCYPGFEKHLEGAEYTAALVQEDGNIITGKGPAASFPYAYRLLRFFVSEEEAKAIEDGMMYNYLMAEK